MYNRYETIFIITPVLTEEQIQETVKKFTKLLKENKAKIIHEEHWGLKKLAYPIQKKSTGVYHLIEFEGEGEVISKLEIGYKREERIIRFLTMKMDKHAIAYAEKKRNDAKQKEEKPKKQEKEVA